MNEEFAPGRLATKKSINRHYILVNYSQLIVSHTVMPLLDDAVK